MPPVWIVLALLPILGGAERFNCKGRILGAYYADAKSGCKAFHVCVRVAGGGVRDFRFFCPPGTLFHQEAQTCTDWGDDDPLACPADLYDGQFDLYKIGSGFDTKKVSSPGNREDEAEFGLQRAETGDRRLNNAPASDLRAAHSSDFFSGQRDRGRDDAPAPPSSSRQSFRRIPTTRAPPTTQYATSSQTQPSNSPQYEQKRKLVRKRPIYTKSTNFVQNNPPQKSAPQSSPQPNYPQQFLQKQSFTQSPAPQQPTTVAQQHFQQATPPQPYQQPQQNFQSPPPVQQNYQNQPSSQQNYNQFNAQQQYQQQSNPKPNLQQNQAFQQQPNPPQLPQQTFNQRTHAQNRVNPPPSPPAIVPPEYKDEYVEVSRVTPKKSRYFATPTTPQYSPSTAAPNFNKKNGLIELYNYESQSTPGISTQKDIKPFKVKNSFNVADLPIQNDQDFARTNVNIHPNGAARASPTTLDYNTASTRSFSTTTPAYRNFNSVSYGSDKNYGFSGSKQNYYNGPSSPSRPQTTTTQRSAAPANLNTVAYNTNNGFNTIQSANYVGNDDDDDDNDDGQYRPPRGEDDGQYRPELYERELLSGAHSLNIAASGNRLPEDQKQKARVQQKPVAQTAAPRPFRPAPTQSVSTTVRTPETTYTTTYRPPQPSTKVTFDAIQTYTTTSRPETPPPSPRVTFSNPPPRPTPPASSSKPPPPRPPQTSFANTPVSNKEDASYDYAYYDSDNGFTEYDQIQEFGKTKKA